MSTQASTLAVVGALLPLVIALLNQAHWPSPVKGLVALAACVVAATVTEAAQGHLNLSDWPGAVVLVGAAALGTYRVLWKPSDIADLVEGLTTFSRKPSAPVVVPAPVEQPTPEQPSPAAGA